MSGLVQQDTLPPRTHTDLDLRFLLASSQVQLKIGQVMNPKVITVGPDTTMAEAATLMSSQRVSCAVVMDADGVQGILSQKDYLFGLATQQKDLYHQPVSAFMSSPVHTATPDCSVLEACHFLDEDGIRRLPVVDEQGGLIGIVTQTDLTRALMSYGAFSEVSEIMSRNVATVPLDATLQDAIACMADRRISCVIALAEGHPVGVLTERDVVSKVSSHQVDPQRIRVEDIMSTPVAHIESDYSIHSAGRLMDQRHVHRLAVMRDGELQGIVTQSDIFRAAHQKLLMEETNRFWLLSRSANSTFVLNSEGQVVYVNPAFLALLGEAEDHVFVGKPFLPEAYWQHPEARDAVIQKLTTGEADIDQFVLQTAQGQIRYVSAIATPTIDTQGRVSDTQGVLYDNTARTLAEQETIRANGDLRIANHELKHMQSQIIQNEKMASIGQLAAGVAHEMNTPVGFVASNFQTLEKYMNRFLDLFKMYEDLGDAVEDGLREKRLDIMTGIRKKRQEMHIDFILEDLDQLFEDSREGLERVTTIIRNLRDFSRIDQVDAQKAFNLNEAIETTLVVARNEIKYNADIEKDLGPLPLIYGNASQINQVFLNLLVNAAQAMASQDTDKRGCITIRTRATEEAVICTISDNGPGIKADTLERIFDPFFTTKPPGKGTGLGLSVSHDIIVQKHQGQLDVASTVGEGTTFTLQLPIRSSEQTMNRAKSPSESDDEV